MLVNERRAWFFLTLIIIILFSSILGYIYFFRDRKPEEVKLKVEVYDFYTGEPIEGLPISFVMSYAPRRVFRGQKSEHFSVSIVSNSSGLAVTEIPSNVILPVSVSSMTMHGSWVLEKVVGEHEVHNDRIERWRRTEWIWSADPQKFASNMSEYEFRGGVDLKENNDASTLILELKLYLAKGQQNLYTIFIPENRWIRQYDPRLEISKLSPNFVYFKGTNLAMVPLEEPLTVNFSLSYYDFSWVASLSYVIDDVEGDFVDLTPSFFRSLSVVQIRDTKEMLDTLEPYGFELTSFYGKLTQITTLYEQAAMSLEDQDLKNASRNLTSVAHLYRDIYIAISNTYIGTMGWTPTLFVILAIFSLALSRLITQRRLWSNIIFVILLFLILSLFISTQPGFRLYIDFVISFITQRLDIPFFALFLFQGLQFISIIVLFFVFTFTRLRDVASQTFGVSIKNLRRRRLKTGLALFTIVIVSASAMSLLTFTPVTPSYRYPIHNRTPKLDGGLIIYKRLVMTSLVGPGFSVTFQPIQPYEIASFSKDWVGSMNVYGIKVVGLRRLDGFTIGNFSKFNMVVVNPQFMEGYLDASEVLGTGFLDSTDRNMILVGSEIASQYNLTSGSEVLLNNRRFIVKSVFDEENAIENLKDIDGDSFLFRIFDPTFIFGSIHDFSTGELSVYKVSIIAKNGYAENITDIAEEFLPLGLDFWTTGDPPSAEWVSSYEIHVTIGGSVLQLSSGKPVTVLSGNWQTQLVPIFITSLILVVNALGTVSERRSEIRTIFTVGASPTRIRFVFILEGTTLGIIGGILGYVLGYGMAQITGFALPSLVQNNMMSGAPFTIAFFTAFLSSLFGCLLPAGASIKSVVPSGALTKKAREIIRTRGEEAILEAPIKLHQEDVKVFNSFLKNLLRRYSYATFRSLIMRELTFTESEDGKLWRFIVNYASDFQVSILTKMDEDIKVSIRPYSFKTRSPARWGGRHHQNLNMMGPLLRKELMSFLDFKRNYQLAERTKILHRKTLRPSGNF